eukprot:gene10905-biopygen2938
MSGPKEYIKERMRSFMHSFGLGMHSVACALYAKREHQRISKNACADGSFLKSSVLFWVARVCNIVSGVTDEWCGHGAHSTQAIPRPENPLHPKRNSQRQTWRGCGAGASWASSVTPVTPRLRLLRGSCGGRRQGGET